MFRLLPTAVLNPATPSRGKPFIHATSAQHNSHFSTPVVFGNKEWSNTCFREIQSFPARTFLHQQPQVESVRALESWIETGDAVCFPLRLMTTQIVILPVNMSLVLAVNTPSKSGLTVARHSNRSFSVEHCFRRLQVIAKTRLKRGRGRGEPCSGT